MPKTVVYAVRLLYLGVIAYLSANSLGTWQTVTHRASGDVQFMLFLMTLALCAVYCLLVSRISDRSKVALILLSIVGAITILNVVTNLGTLFEQFAQNPFVVAFGYAAAILQTVGLALLFVPASREWFKQRPQPL